ncbi:hypothetical protein [uncultured Desulfovibrio sp.]|uniref:hypothetical protein n=1 Tax=uncultured Desulfovibrio sp. TaxID=167968 RepID=UPI00260DDFF8|nr:hypothetical protein [uncultured Desulfovibrio sp.]
MTTLFNCSIKQFYAMAADSNRDAGSFALFRHAAAPAPARGTGLTALKKFYLKINQQEAQRDEVAFAPPQRSAGGWLVSGES